jgi:ABC-type multidrug transport system fused ATPase/permease subunit
MFRFTNYPVLIFFLTFALMWVSAWFGIQLRAKSQKEAEVDQGDFGVILGATLTLLGLIIGFTFSMATNRYDQRKNLEEEEANAIGTEYVRLDLLPAEAATKAKDLLVRYTDLRVEYYQTRRRDELDKVNAETASIQDQLWSTVAAPAKAKPDTNTWLAISGMNDVLNSQGYTQAAWWNRIPRAAWCLMFAIAIVSHIMVGYGSHRKRSFLSVVLPLLVAVSFLLIADIDSPRGGLIRVWPQNLIAFAASLKH